MTDAFSLKIYIQPTPSVPERQMALRKWYKEKIEAYMAKVIKNQTLLDSGFDLLIPDGTDGKKLTITPNAKAFAIDHGVVCVVFNSENIPQPFYLYPRSSISGTPLRLANSVGIIDSGYRGNLIAKVDNVCDSEHVVSGSRLFQVCSRTLSPFYHVELVESLDFDTERGAGGFGSTGGTASAAATSSGSYFS